MIESINIRNIATYDAAGIQINDLKKVNFIYGANGTGKTTITKYIYNLNDPLYNSCSLNWKHSSPIATLVYNKDFRDKNFGKGDIDGVFTLGQATKDVLEAIEKKRIERKKIIDDGKVKKETLDKQIILKGENEAEFREEVWIEIYKKNENLFKEAFKGVMQKETFKTKLLDEYRNNHSPLLTFEELKEMAQTIFGKIPITLPNISHIAFERLIEIENDKIWQKKIIGKSDVNIAALIQRLNLNDWVNDGRKYLEDKTCPFCQNLTITDDFRNQLDAYFDETFIHETGVVKSHSDEYNLLALNLINLLTQIEASEKINGDSKLEKDKFSAYLKTLSSQLIVNKELLNSKIKEPSRDISLTPTKEQLQKIEKLIIDTNKKIDIHNEIVSNYAVEKSNLIQGIWKYLVEENRIRIDNFLKYVIGYQLGIDEITKQLEVLRNGLKKKEQEIKDLNKTVTSIQQSIDDINKTLTSYGFYNFSIIPSKTGINKYQIQRADGTLAESTLSEGEITFITFLYFLQLSKGSTLEANIADERVLIVDDPISSLDSNILFVISSLLKEAIKLIKQDKGNIKQLILLTHNVYFHKEVSFIDGRTKKCKNTSFWILRRNKNISSIQSFGMDNPIQNSYELLWMELKNKANSSGLTIQNTMRRIIENYFKILGKYGDDELIEKFENSQEKEICRSLISWINDGSHSVPDDLYIEMQENIIDKYLEVFKNIFCHTNHLEHYKMMMGEAE